MSVGHGPNEKPLTGKTAIIAAIADGCLEPLFAGSYAVCTMVLRTSTVVSRDRKSTRTRSRKALHCQILPSTTKAGAVRRWPGRSVRACDAGAPVPRGGQAALASSGSNE